MNDTRTTDSITIIGPAVIDVITGPVAFSSASLSQTVKTTRMTFGGDALNESVVLSRFHKNADLISKLGTDEAGARILSYLKNNGISARHVQVTEGLETSVHIVLVNEHGERSFLMNESGSARRLSSRDILPLIPRAAQIVSFASLFISPLLTLDVVENIFREIKKDRRRKLVVDVTRPKNGETLRDLEGILPYVDYILPNDSEIASLTGIQDPHVNADLLVEAGAGCAVVKTGSKGCIVRTRESVTEIPAYRGADCIDTTGAGDTFAAGFLWALSEGYSPQECGRFGCAAASCSIEAFGAVDGITSIDEPMRRYRQMKALI